MAAAISGNTKIAPAAASDDAVHRVGWSPRAAGPIELPIRLIARAAPIHLPEDLTWEAGGLDFKLAMAYAKSGWTALSDPTRRRIFELLVERPSSVNELAGVLPVTRPAVSQHLKVLKGARLVVDTRAGKHRIYRVDPEGLAELRAELDRFWMKTLAAYKRVVEQPPEE